MELVSKLDDYGKPAWIAVMVLGFIIFWPVGLAILGYLIWSGRMSCWKSGGAGRWYNERKERRHAGWHGSSTRQPTGNRAFDEYRQQTLRRLEQEHEEFMEFLETLRQARDKAEFDQFMKDRRDRAGDTDAPESAEPPAPQPAN